MYKTTHRTIIRNVHYNMSIEYFCIEYRVFIEQHVTNVHANHDFKAVAQQ